MSEQQTPHVYTAICDVMLALSKIGIGKEGENKQQGYKFRGIDQIQNALARLLPVHKLVILPRVLSRDVVERTTKSGGALFYVVADVEYVFVSQIDGSKHTVRVIGEAQDSGDKASNKAMSAAYKYMAIQSFCIPTEGDNDADATTHEEVKPTAPEGYEKWKADLSAVADEGTERLREVWKGSPKPLRDYATGYELEWWNSVKAVAERNKAAA